jgi:hypothetical protein
MQKVEGSSPFSRFRKLLQAGGFYGCGLGGWPDCSSGWKRGGSLRRHPPCAGRRSSSGPCLRGRPPASSRQDPHFLPVRSLSNRAASTPDLVTVWMAVAKSGVPQREAALEARTLPANCRCRRFPASRTRVSTAVGSCSSIEEQARLAQGLTIASRDERSSTGRRAGDSLVAFGLVSSATVER